VPNHSADQGSRVTADANLALSGFPTANNIEETTMRHYEDNERAQLAKHRGQPVKCEQCASGARHGSKDIARLDVRCALAVSGIASKWPLVR
jgi:hypothetical protein